jgi:hypothetical protein
MSSASEEAEPRQEEAPTMVIKAPPNYEQTHELAQCPLCNSPNPILDMHLPVRWYEYFDTNLYTCDTRCECHYGAERDPITDKITIKPHKHKFSAKHDILTDASHLKIYDRTHFKDVW